MCGTKALWVSNICLIIYFVLLYAHCIYLVCNFFAIVIKTERCVISVFFRPVNRRIVSFSVQHDPFWLESTVGELEGAFTIRLKFENTIKCRC